MKQHHSINYTMRSSGDMGSPQEVQKLSMLCNLSSTLLIAAGTVAGWVIMNPIILGIIPGSGLILKTLKWKTSERKSNYVSMLVLPTKRNSLN